MARSEGVKVLSNVGHWIATDRERRRKAPGNWKMGTVRSELGAGNLETGNWELVMEWNGAKLLLLDSTRLRRLAQTHAQTAAV